MLSSMASAEEPFSCDTHFGENIQIITDKISFGYKRTAANLRGDFNGDKLEDTIVILKLNKASRFNEDIILSNPPVIWFSDRKPDVQPANADKVPTPEKDTIALGIIQSELSDKRKCRKFVIYNTDYFPTSEAKYLAVGIIPAGDIRYGYPYHQREVLEKLGEDLRYDAIYLSTPKSTAWVYWSNGRYILDLPNDPEESDN
jgi:hypothetical protein